MFGKCLIVSLLVAATLAAPTVDVDEHSVQKRNTAISDVARLFDGSPITLSTVAIVIIILLALDVVFTLLFAAAFSGRSRQDFTIPVVGELMENVYNRVDVVEMALSYMSVEEEACRYKAVCKAERAMVGNPIGALAINTINSRLSGLSKYASAVEAGLRGDDCDLLYDQCPQHLGF